MMNQMWSFALYANIGGTLFFFFIGVTDKFSWLIEFVLLLCAVSNALWWYMFNELRRSTNTQAVFAGGLVVALTGAVLHWRRPMPDPEDESDSDEDSDDEELSQEQFLEKIRQEERELAALKALQAKRLAQVPKGTLTKRNVPNKKVQDEEEETSNF